MLPTSRIRTYVLGSPVIPDDINAIQDAIIGAKCPLLTIGVPITGFVLGATGATPVVLAHGSVTIHQADFAAASVPVGAITSVLLTKGTRIVNARLYVKDVSGGQPPLVTRLLIGNRAGATTTISTINSAATGIAQTLNHNAINYTIGATDGPLVIAVNTAINATGTYSVYAIELDVDRL